MTPLDDMTLKLDGPGVKPSTVDARLVLGVALAFVNTLEAIGKYESGREEPPLLIGLKALEAKSIDLVMNAFAREEGEDIAGLWNHVTERLPVYVRAGTGVARPLRPKILALYKATRLLPQHITADAIGPSSAPQASTFSLTDAVREQVPLLRSVETFRAYMIRTGGISPRVQLRPSGQDSTVVMRAPKELLLHPKSFNYKYADITADVTREARSPHGIVDGKIRSLTLVDETGDEVAAFDEWNKAMGRPWRGTKDIEGELRRGRH